MMIRKRRENVHVIKRPHLSPQQQPNSTPIIPTTGTVDGLTEHAASSNKFFFRPIMPRRSCYSSASGGISSNDTESNDLRRTLEKSGMRLIGEEVEWIADDGNYHYYQ